MNIIMHFIGWLVLQRRINGKMNFEQNWNEYKNGFGDPNEEFWLGNEKINLISEYADLEIRLNLRKSDASKFFARFSSFRIGNESRNYQLLIEEYDITSKSKCYIMYI